MTTPTAAATASTTLSPLRRWTALGVLSLAVLLIAIDGTVLALAVPSLTEALGATANQVLWIGDIYSLAIAGLLIPMGALADRIGRKKLLLIGSFLFGAASLMAALSPSAEMLILARLLLGVAGATLMPSTLSLIRNIFTDRRERTRAIAIWSAAASGGAALGPLVGGALLEHFFWGSVFLINVPVVVVLIGAGLFVLPESRDPDPGPIDLLSALLVVAAIAPIVYAIKHTVQAGVDPIGIACLAAGLAIGFLFVRRQRRLTQPLLDIDLFRVPAFSGAVFAAFLAVFSLSGLLYFFSLYLQLARGFSPLQAGLAELPTTLASILVVALVGWVVAKIGPGRGIATGLLLVALGMVGIALAEGVDHYFWLALALVPVGLGVGLAQTLTVDAVVSAVPPHKSGAASAISETAYELGVAFGIAILGSVLNLAYRGMLQLPAGLDAADRAAAQDSLAMASATLDQGSAALEAAQHAFTSAMQVTALAAAAISVIGAIVAWRTIVSERAGQTGPVEQVGEAQA